MSDVRDYHTDFDHMDPDFGDRLYAITAELRETCPVAHSNQHGGFVALSRYEDVHNTLLDYATFSSADGITLPRASGAAAAVPLECDPPESRSFRALLAPYFTPAAVTRWEPAIVRRVDELLDRLAADEPADLAADFAVPLPGFVICDLMGLPTEDVDKMIDWQKRAFESSDPEAIAAFGAYLAAQLDDRRANPREDLVSVIAHAEIDGTPLPKEQAIAMAHLVAAAGFETTGSALGHLLATIGANSQLRAGLVNGTEDLATVVEESLRFETPLQGVARTVRKPVTVSGTDLPIGQRVAILFGSANRDPAKFDEADVFDSRRAPNRHLSFGSGVHICLGIHLARAEMRIAVQRLLDRFPKFQLAGEPQIVHRSFIRAVDHLPAHLSPP
jgi:cytochrome P450